ncbi:MAG: hypothetical protein KY463_12775, partial [Actinobacteria bacterium]|nr:hypothetical protein [Actinomycetota bacterium]
SRTYAKVDGRLTFEAFLAQSIAGRSYVSDGRSHAIDFRANALELGTGKSELRLSRPADVTFSARVSAMLPPEQDSVAAAASRGAGERPYWSPDGTRIAFIETNYGDACELDFATRTVRNLTKGLGDHHSFLRVLIMHDDSYLLIGPKEFKDRHTSRHIESEMWWMDRAASRPPVPLGRWLYEGMGVSWTAPRITYAMNGHHDPALGSPDAYACHVAEIEHTPDGPKLVDDQVVYRADSGRRPEPQDFRRGDGEVIFAEYVGRRDAKGLVRAHGARAVQDGVRHAQLKRDAGEIHSNFRGYIVRAVQGYADGTWQPDPRLEQQAERARAHEAARQRREADAEARRAEERRIEAEQQETARVWAQLSPAQREDLHRQVLADMDPQTRRFSEGTPLDSRGMRALIVRRYLEQQR